MSVKSCQHLIKYLTPKQLRYYAAIGLNDELNGMSPEDAEVMKASLKKAKKKPKNCGFALDPLDLPSDSGTP